MSLALVALLHLEACYSAPAHELESHCQIMYGIDC